MLQTGFKRLLVLPLALVACYAQEGQTDKPKSETGSMFFDVNGGWLFGFPAVQAYVATPAGTAVSPQKKSLPAYGFDANVRIWRFFVPFFELSAIDTGKATASVGTVQSTAQANTYSLNGGIRFEPAHGRLRPYVRFAVAQFVRTSAVHSQLPPHRRQLLPPDPRPSLCMEAAYERLLEDIGARSLDLTSITLLNPLTVRAKITANSASDGFCKPNLP
jgi:hypothetical protein